MSCSERFILAAKAVLDRETEATEKVVKMSRSALLISSPVTYRHDLFQALDIL
jgi:hypothetical protein